MRTFATHPASLMLALLLSLLAGCGGGSDPVTAPVTTPDAFTFTDVTNQTLNTQVESNTITVAGINAAANISITGGQYSINGGAYTAVAGTITNGQTVKVSHFTSGANSTTVNTTLTIGGVSDTYSSTTVNGYVVQGGLTWMPNNIGPWAGGYTDWNTANTYCTTATINGQTGWRLPTQPELSALYASGAIVAGLGWTKVLTWSSTSYEPGTHSVVDLDGGREYWLRDTFNNVSCVR